jgi:hypothetical protein
MCKYLLVQRSYYFLKETNTLIYNRVLSEYSRLYAYFIRERPGITY